MWVKSNPQAQIIFLAFMFKMPPLKAPKANRTPAGRIFRPTHVSFRQDAVEDGLPYIYLDKIFHELRDELLSAMHSAVERNGRNGQIDVDRLYRAFTRAAAGKCANPQRVSERCVTETSTSRSRRGKDARIEE